MSRALPLLAALALAGCTGATLPAPTVVSVSPAERPASSSGPVTVMVEAVLPTFVDHSAQAVSVDDRLSLSIGPRPFGPSRWADAGVITDFLPSVLPEGSYDVTVELADDQRQAVRMRYLEGEPLAVVAERMQRSPDAVVGLIRRGLVALRRHLGGSVLV